jgi:hypothetical protein
MRLDSCHALLHGYCGGILINLERGRVSCGAVVDGDIAALLVDLTRCLLADEGSYLLVAHVSREIDGCSSDDKENWNGENELH